MRPMGSTRGEGNSAKPGGNAWPPTRQQRKEIVSRICPPAHALPPRPEVPPVRPPTPGKAAPLAPQEPGPNRVPAAISAGEPKRDHGAARNHAASAEREAAANSIEKASIALHRTEALLMQFKVAGRKGPNVGQALDEAKHTYQQGLSRFREGSYVTAKELATASSDLSRAVAILLARELRPNAADALFVAPQGIHRATAEERPGSHDEFSSIGSRLSRILWLFENGTLPSEVIEQARKIASWSEYLYREAQKSFREGAWDDALELVQAAEAAAYSAEHVCKMCYLKDG